MAPARARDGRKHVRLVLTDPDPMISEANGRGMRRYAKSRRFRSAPLKRSRALKNAYRASYMLPALELSTRRRCRMYFAFGEMSKPC